MNKADYREKIARFREQIADAREKKKKDNAYYADKIRVAGSSSVKAAYRNKKAAAKERNDREIESLKGKIETAKYRMKQCKN